MQPKRLLYLSHRWLGVLLCLFFAPWFISGVVMMYVGHPKLTAPERLAHLPALTAPASLLSPQQALQAAGLGERVADLRLAVASAGQAVYLVTPAPTAAGAEQPKGKKGRRKADTVVVDAHSGQVLNAFDQGAAMVSATAFMGGRTGLVYAGTVTEDAHTHSKALDPHRPLHLVHTGDADGTWLYVSSRTGEVVRDAPAVERNWNYLGSWMHWLYPFRGNVFDPYWSDIVIWLSVAGTVVVLLGLVNGLLRWRFDGHYKSGSRSPYQSRMMRWHHVYGLLFCAISLTWVFSGLMSMNPWGVLNGGAPPGKTEAMQGGPLKVNGDFMAPTEILQRNGNASVRELQWLRLLRKDLVMVNGPHGMQQLLDARNGQPYVPTQDEIVTAAARLRSEPITEVALQREADFYYYSREPHTMSGGEKPLPVLRLAYADEHHTVAYVDPRTGSLVQQVDDARRVRRWLFSLLHSWDWLPLLNHRPLWDVVMVGLSVGGTVISLTSLVIGWRRLRTKARQWRAARRTPAMG
ncbi:MAG: PepSY domain-containing protein [Vitreoscilla sp.]|nr:PepSY domain-containing protein [Burkholderiales bacterium]MBP6336683.1 PepSY domain-containing protein [Vitreoscilla sp.]MBP6674613.1 PepSY domain-containing protein [Vitreoscilla sp.]